MQEKAAHCCGYSQNAFHFRANVINLRDAIVFRHMNYRCSGGVYAAKGNFFRMLWRRKGGKSWDLPVGPWPIGDVKILRIGTRHRCRRYMGDPALPLLKLMTLGIRGGSP